MSDAIPTAPTGSVFECEIYWIRYKDDVHPCVTVEEDNNQVKVIVYINTTNRLLDCDTAGLTIPRSYLYSFNDESISQGTRKHYEYAIKTQIEPLLEAMKDDPESKQISRQSKLEVVLYSNTNKKNDVSFYWHGKLPYRYCFSNKEVVASKCKVALKNVVDGHGFPEVTLDELKRNCAILEGFHEDIKALQKRVDPMDFDKCNNLLMFYQQAKGHKMLLDKKINALELIRSCDN